MSLHVSGPVANKRAHDSVESEWLSRKKANHNELGKVQNFELECILGITKSDCDDLVLLMMSKDFGVKLTDEHIDNKVFSNCFRATALIEWLKLRFIGKDDMQASKIAKHLFNLGYFTFVNGNQEDFHQEVGIYQWNNASNNLKKEVLIDECRETVDTRAFGNLPDSNEQNAGKIKDFPFEFPHSESSNPPLQDNDNTHEGVNRVTEVKMRAEPQTKKFNRVIFYLSRNTLHETYSSEDYERCDWVDMDTAMEKWEEEEDEERLRQLEDRWMVMEANLPSGQKCKERIFFQSETSRIREMARKVHYRASEEGIDATQELVVYMQIADRLYNDLIAGHKLEVETAMDSGDEPTIGNQEDSKYAATISTDLHHQISTREQNLDAGVNTDVTSLQNGRKEIAEKPSLLAVRSGSLTSVFDEIGNFINGGKKITILGETTTTIVGNGQVFRNNPNTLSDKILSKEESDTQKNAKKYIQNEGIQKITTSINEILASKTKVNPGLEWENGKLEGHFSKPGEGKTTTIGSAHDSPTFKECNLDNNFQTIANVSTKSEIDEEHFPSVRQGNHDDKTISNQSNVSSSKTPNPSYSVINEQGHEKVEKSANNSVDDIQGEFTTDLRTQDQNRTDRDSMSVNKNKLDSMDCHDLSISSPQSKVVSFGKGRDGNSSHVLDFLNFSESIPREPDVEVLRDGESFSNHLKASYKSNTEANTLDLLPNIEVRFSVDQKEMNTIVSQQSPAKEMEELIVSECLKVDGKSREEEIPTNNLTHMDIIPIHKITPFNFSDQSVEKHSCTQVLEENQEKSKPNNITNILNNDSHLTSKVSAMVENSLTNPKISIGPESNLISVKENISDSSSSSIPERKTFAGSCLIESKCENYVEETKQSVNELNKKHDFAEIGIDIEKKSTIDIPNVNTQDDLHNAQVITKDIHFCVGAAVGDGAKPRRKSMIGAHVSLAHQIFEKNVNIDDNIPQKSEPATRPLQSIADINKSNIFMNERKTKSESEPTFSGKDIAKLFSLAVLTQTPNSLLQSWGVILDRKEDFLEDNDFKVAFGCTREEFGRLPAWRKLQRKKEAKLF